MPKSTNASTQAEPAAYRALVERLLADDPGVTETQMMGMPSLKAAGRLFAGRVGDELVLKLGRERAGELIAGGRARPFDPAGRGRAMKDWAVLPGPSDDWLELALEARSLAGR